MDVNTTIEIRDKEKGISICLSLEEAREVYEKLRIVFDNTPVYIPYYPTDTKPTWCEPIWKNLDTVTCRIGDVSYTLT